MPKDDAERALEIDKRRNPKITPTEFVVNIFIQGGMAAGSVPLTDYKIAQFAARL